MWYIYKNQKYFTIISVASAWIKVIPIIFLTEFCLKGYWEINIYKHFQSVSKFCFFFNVYFPGMFHLYFIPSWKWKCKSLSCVQLFVTPWTVEFSRPEYWTGLPFPFPGDLSKPAIELKSPTLQADSFPSKPPENMLGNYFQNILTINI